MASPIPSIYYSNNGSRYTGMCAQIGIPIIAPTALRTCTYVRTRRVYARRIVVAGGTREKNKAPLARIKDERSTQRD